MSATHKKMVTKNFSSIFHFFTAFETQHFLVTISCYSLYSFNILAHRRKLKEKLVSSESIMFRNTAKNVFQITHMHMYTNHTNWTFLPNCIDYHKFFEWGLNVFQNTHISPTLVNFRKDLLYSFSFLHCISKFSS